MSVIPLTLGVGSGGATCKCTASLLPCTTSCTACILESDKKTKTVSINYRTMLLQACRWDHFSLQKCRKCSISKLIFKIFVWGLSLTDWNQRWWQRCVSSTDVTVWSSRQAAAGNRLKLLDWWQRSTPICRTALAFLVCWAKLLV